MNIHDQQLEIFVGKQRRYTDTLLELIRKIKKMLDFHPSNFPFDKNGSYLFSFFCFLRSENVQGKPETLSRAYTRLPAESDGRRLYLQTNPDLYCSEYRKSSFNQ